MFCSSGVAETIFLSSGTDELCNRIKLFLQEKQDGNFSDMINEGIAAIVDYLLEYKCLSKKQHKQLLTICNLLHTSKKYVKLLI